MASKATFCVSNARCLFVVCLVLFLEGLIVSLDQKNQGGRRCAAPPMRRPPWGRWSSVHHRRQTMPGPEYFHKHGDRCTWPSAIGRKFTRTVDSVRCSPDLDDSEECFRRFRIMKIQRSGSTSAVRLHGLVPYSDAMTEHTYTPLKMRISIALTRTSSGQKIIPVIIPPAVRASKSHNAETSPSLPETTTIWTTGVIRVNLRPIGLERL